MIFVVHLVYLALAYGNASRELRTADLLASPLGPALTASPADFERCFADNQPAVASVETIACTVIEGGLCAHAGIETGPQGIDAPGWDLVHDRGLCLIDQFNLRPGVQATANTPVGLKLHTTFTYMPTASPRLVVQESQPGAFSHLGR